MSDGCIECNKWACDCPASIRTHHTVIEEAAHLVRDTRAVQHGKFEHNAEIAARILHELGVRVDTDEIPLVLVALKLARHRSNPTNRDNIVDAIGYLGLYAQLIGLEAE